MQSWSGRMRESTDWSNLYSEFVFNEHECHAIDIFTAQCYASAVLAMGLCPSVCLPVTSRCSIETAERIELVFGM